MRKQVESHVVEQIQAVVRTELGCRAGRSDDGGLWLFEGNEHEVKSAALRLKGDRLELLVTLASVTGSTKAGAVDFWGIVAGLQEKTERAGTCLAPIAVQNGYVDLAVSLELHNAPLDLPRLSKLRQSLRAVREVGSALRALPGFGAPLAQAQIPQDLSDYLAPFETHTYADTGSGRRADVIAHRLEAGVPVALVGQAVRVLLELQRLAVLLPAALVLPKVAIRVDELPRLLTALGKDGLVLAMHSSLLRPSLSIYEMGRDLDALFHQLKGMHVGLIVHGSREELESTLGVGQGRAFSPLYPVIETLPPAVPLDLAWTGLAQHAIAPQKRSPDPAAIVVNSITTRAKEAFDEKYILPLAAVVAKVGPGHPNLASVLGDRMVDLTGRRDTFGCTGEAPATPRPQWLQQHFREKLNGSDFAEFLKMTVVGQDRPVKELAARLFREAVSRSRTVPLRVLQSGPPGTGKSLVAKLTAEYLGLPYHYIDAASFSGAHSVAATLTGAAPGLVSSHQDGTLARIARRPSLVEIADLDHAPPDVRQALTDCSLRILQEGTLQAGSGAIIRSLPNVIFVFTSNVAHTDQQGPVRQFGFGHPTNDPAQIRERVRELMIRELGYAFVSRVGDPIVYDEFTPETAVALVQHEIVRLVTQATNAVSVDVAEQVATAIVEHMPSLAGGARRIIDEINAWIAPALGSLDDERGHALEVIRVQEQLLTVRRKKG